MNPGRCQTQINSTFVSVLVMFAVDHAVDDAFIVLQGVLEVFLNFYNLSSKQLHAVYIKYTCTHMRIHALSHKQHLHAKTHTRMHARAYAVHTHARTYVYTNTHALTHASTHACMHVYIFEHARTHACKYACMHTHTHARTDARTYTRNISS